MLSWPQIPSSYHPFFSLSFRRKTFLYLLSPLPLFLLSLKLIVAWHPSMILLKLLFKVTYKLPNPVVSSQSLCYLIICLETLSSFFQVISSSSLPLWLFLLNTSVFILIFMTSFHCSAWGHNLWNPLPTSTHLYSRWSYPIPSLNTIFIQITFICLFLALISLLKSRLKYPAIYSIFSSGYLRAISNLNAQTEFLFPSIKNKQQQKPTSSTVILLSVNEISILSVA